MPYVPVAVVNQTATGGGALTQILDSTLGGSQASFDTNTILGGNISSSYTCLLGQVQGKCDAGSVQQCRIRFNNDSGNNYDRQQVAGSSASASAEQATAQSSARLGTFPGTDGSAGSSGAIFFEVPNYNGTVFHKIALSKCMVLYTGTPTLEIEVEGIRWASTSAITRIQLLMGDGSNMIAGTRFTLWGVT